MSERKRPYNRAHRHRRHRTRRPLPWELLDTFQPGDRVFHRLDRARTRCGVVIETYSNIVVVQWHPPDGAHRNHGAGDLVHAGAAR